MPVCHGESTWPGGDGKRDRQPRSNTPLPLTGRQNLEQSCNLLDPGVLDNKMQGVVQVVILKLPGRRGSLEAPPWGQAG